MDFLTSEPGSKPQLLLTFLYTWRDPASQQRGRSYLKAVRARGSEPRN